mmetsp:Transcript_57157/g.127504  ORF Transcript_57157/g.127504 Transcript_57157/m.127504 type:complete len:248 (+) Transcript_57157:244-987(+)
MGPAAAHWQVGSMPRRRQRALGRFGCPCGGRESLAGLALVLGDLPTAQGCAPGHPVGSMGGGPQTRPGAARRPFRPPRGHAAGPGGRRCEPFPALELWPHNAAPLRGGARCTARRYFRARVVAGPSPGHAPQRCRQRRGDLPRRAMRKPAGQEPAEGWGRGRTVSLHVALVATEEGQGQGKGGGGTRRPKCGSQGPPARPGALRRGGPSARRPDPPTSEPPWTGGVFGGRCLPRLCPLRPAADGPPA